MPVRPFPFGGEGAVTAVTNVGTTVTFTAANNLAAGQTVVVAGVTGFTTNNPNGTFVVTSATPTQFVVTVGSAPTGAYTSGGTVTFSLGPVGPLFRTNAVQGKPAENQFFKFLGLSLVETGGSSTVRLTVTDSTGQVVGVASAPAGQSPPPLWFGPEGVQCQGQLTVTASGTGTPSGVVYIR